MRREVVSRLVTWAALMALLALTVAGSFAPLGHARLGVSLAIAAAKTALIAWVFMEVGRMDRIARLATLAGLVIMSLLVGLSLMDAFNL